MTTTTRTRTRRPLLALALTPLALALAPLALALALAAPAAAQGAAEEALLQRTFRNYDRNKDRIVLREEFPGSDAQFTSMDANKNGKVTYAEFKASPVARRILASRRRDRSEPRPRVSLEQLAHKRLRHLFRFDKNGDGRVTRVEWAGTEAAFNSLDLDRNGILDRLDRKAAGRPLTRRDPAREILESFKARLPGAKELLGQWDRDKDGQLVKDEVPRDKPFHRLFDHADDNGDKHLDERELRRAIGQVNAWVNLRNAGGQRRQRAFAVPFAAWDKNDDGRLDTREWIQRKGLFKRIDVDRDAHVTRQEVERYRRSIEGRDFIEKHDLNGDGHVSLEEFGCSPGAFRRADRNGDGYISSRDR